jgi:hypothetical protein
MKLAVCGCSFSAVSHLEEFKGTHWSEILAEKLNARLYNFARQGISNSVIRLQINEAIRIKPDWVFINATTPERIEFPVEDKKYDVNLRLKNFNYSKENYNMVSETMFSIIDNHPHEYRREKVSKHIRDAVELHTALLFDRKWQEQKDNWILSSGVWRLHDLGIKFFYNPWTINHPAEPLHNLPKWFTEKYFLSTEFNLMNLFNRFEKELVKSPPYDVGYHTPVEEQQIIADKYLNLMKSKES